MAPSVVRRLGNVRGTVVVRRTVPVIAVLTTGPDQRHDHDGHQQDQLRSDEARHSAQRSNELEAGRYLHRRQV